MNHADLDPVLERFLEAVPTGDTAALAGFANIEKLINQTDDEGWTPLMWAAATGQEGSARMLLGRRVDINAQSDKGETALMCAAESNDENMLLLLVHAGARADLQNKAGDTLRSILEDNGRPDLIEKINKHIADVATRAEQPIKVSRPLVLKKPGM